MTKPATFWGALAALVAAGLLLTQLVENEYYFNALYLILQATLMAVAWNILGGFTGYVNFGSAGFFAIGAYTTVVLNKALGLPLPLLIVAGGAIGGLVGLGLGYLTLRLKGVYFAIATLALAQRCGASAMRARTSGTAWRSTARAERPSSMAKA